MVFVSVSGRVVMVDSRRDNSSPVVQTRSIQSAADVSYGVGSCRTEISELRHESCTAALHGFTGAQELIGDISVSLVNEMLSSPPVNRLMRQWMFQNSGSDIPFLRLVCPSVHPPGSQQRSIAGPNAAYYLPADLSVNVADLSAVGPCAEADLARVPDYHLADITNARRSTNPRLSGAAPNPRRYPTTTVTLFRLARRSYAEQCSQRSTLADAKVQRIGRRPRVGLDRRAVW